MIFEEKQDKVYNGPRDTLSMHAKNRHKDNFSLKNFSVAVIKQVSPQNLRREEFSYIEK